MEESGGKLAISETRTAQGHDVDGIREELYRSLVAPRTVQAIPEPPRTPLLREVYTRLKEKALLGRRRLTRNCQVPVDGLSITTSFGRWSELAAVLIDVLDLSGEQEAIRFRHVATTNVKFREVRNIRGDSELVVLARMPEGGKKTLPSVETKLLQEASNLVDFDNEQDQVGQTLARVASRLEVIS
jgi:hypothetical protein